MRFFVKSTSRKQRANICTNGTCGLWICIATPYFINFWTSTKWITLLTVWNNWSHKNVVFLRNVFFKFTLSVRRSKYTFHENCNAIYTDKIIYAFISIFLIYPLVIVLRTAQSLTQNLPSLYRASGVRFVCYVATRLLRGKLNLINSVL